MTAPGSYPPVLGVDFAGYVDIMIVASKAMYENASKGIVPAPGDDPYLPAAIAKGLDPAGWRRVQLVWGSRCGINPEMTAQMASEISVAMGYPAPSIPIQPMPVVDPNDPALAPIEGVTIDAYVQFVRATMVDGAETPEQQADAAAGLGFPAGRWESIVSAWGDRVTAGHPVSTRYMQLVSDLLG